MSSITRTYCGRANELPTYSLLVLWKGETTPSTWSRCISMKICTRNSILLEQKKKKTCSKNRPISIFFLFLIITRLCEFQKKKRNEKLCSCLDCSSPQFFFVFIFFFSPFLERDLIRFSFSPLCCTASHPSCMDFFFSILISPRIPWLPFFPLWPLVYSGSE